MLLALIQKLTVSKVEKGENEGRTLTYARIVGALDVVPQPFHKAGTKELPAPAGFNYRDWEVVGLLQNQETGEINAVTWARFD